MKLMTIAQIEDAYGYPKKVGESKESFMKRVEKELKKKPQVAKSVLKARTETPETPIMEEHRQPLIDYVAPLGCTVTFPTPETWQINYRGREDSGHISADLQTAINQIIK